MKTIKRSLSVALIACLLLSLLVPTAWAMNKAEDYSFKYKDSVTFTLKADGNAYFTDDGANYSALQTAYSQEKVNSMCLSWKTSYPNQFPAITDKGLSLIAYVGDWLAFKIKSPGAGTFEVGVVPFSDSGAAKGVDIFVLDMDTVSEDIAATVNNLDSGKAINDKDVNIFKTDETQIAGLSDFEADKEYLVVLRVTLNKNGNENKDVTFDPTTNKATDANKATRADFKLVGLTMTPVVASVNGTGYATLALAEDAADDNGGEIKLLADVSENIDLSAGVTLDLNGHTVTADTVKTVSGSYIKDGSEKDTGAVILNEGGTWALSADNKELPLKVGNAYRFFSCQVKSAGQRTAGNAQQFWIQVKFDNTAAYALINSQDNAGLKVKAEWTWKGNTLNDIDFANYVTSWASKMGGTTEYGFYVNISNFPENGDLTVTPKIEAGNVVIKADTAMTYAYSA